jgi:hypothetical protein
MSNPDGLPYDFVQASWDYGRRQRAVQTVVFHLAESSRRSTSPVTQSASTSSNSM